MRVGWVQTYPLVSHAQSSCPQTRNHNLKISSSVLHIWTFNLLSLAMLFIFSEVLMCDSHLYEKFFKSLMTLPLFQYLGKPRCTLCYLCILVEAKWLEFIRKAAFLCVQSLYFELYINGVHVVWSLIDCLDNTSETHLCSTLHLHSTQTIATEESF